jgi:hypothetical protein
MRLFFSPDYPGDMHKVVEFNDVKDAVAFVVDYDGNASGFVMGLKVAENAVIVSWDTGSPQVRDDLTAIINALTAARDYVADCESQWWK